MHSFDRPEGYGIVVTARRSVRRSQATAVLHNVVEYATNHAPANYAFLGSSVVFSLVGWFLFNLENKRIYAG